LESPPKILNESRVLEFVIFDKDVKRTALVLLDAGPGEPRPEKALAICQSLHEDFHEVLYLYKCTEDWSVDRQQVWNWPGGGPKADTTEVLRTHASTLFTGLDRKWVKVAPIQTVHLTKKRSQTAGRPLRKWWQFWR
jgi:hypothetical protein